MAVVNGTLWSVETVKSDERDALQGAVVYFTVSGTYAQADNMILSGVPTLIQNARKNGKTVSMRGACLWQAARKESNPGLLMGLKTVAIAGTDITAEITESATVGAVEASTELAAGAVPAQSVPFGVLVTFVES